MQRKKQATQAEQVEQICAYCVYATPLSKLDICLCKKHGAVRSDGTCRRFQLDLLKIQPHLPLPSDAVPTAVSAEETLGW